MPRFDDTFRERVRARLARFRRRPIDDGARSRASVAFVLVGDPDGRAAFVLTRRPLSIKRHAGQWALPGGRRDQGETAEQTARRELVEEVGLDLAPAAVLGQLDDFATRSGFVITPVVLWGPREPALCPNPDEVHQAHVVALEALDAPGTPRVIASESRDRPLLCFPVASLGTTIWAPTAALLYQCRELLIHGRTERVAHYEQPRFAWR